MKPIYLFLCVLAILAALLTLDQIWFGWLSEETYFKLLISEVVIGGLVLVIYALRNEFLDDKKLKDDKFVN